MRTTATLSVVRFPVLAHILKQAAEDEAVAKAGRYKGREVVVEVHGGRSEETRKNKVTSALNSKHCSKKQRVQRKLLMDLMTEAMTGLQMLQLEAFVRLTLTA